MSGLENFPFCGIIKQEDVKEALILNLINPRIGGVLIDGCGGTAKSVLAGSVGAITDMKVIKLPLNISEDRLIGSVDVEKTIKSGSATLEKGVLSMADGGILLIDDVALLPDEITDVLLEVLSNGVARVEREGISHEEKCSFMLIGTMDSSKQQLRNSLTDHFGMYAKTQNLDTPEDRLKIMRVRDAFDSRFEDRDENIPDKMKNETLRLKESIIKARERMEGISITGDVLELIVKKVLEANAEGHRADIVMKEAVKAVAAFHEREEITQEDVDEAAYFVLPHRMRPGAQPEEEEQTHNEEEPEEQEQEPERQEEPPRHEEDPKDPGQEEPEEQEDNEPPEEPPEDEGESSGKGRYKTVKKAFATGDDFKVIDFSHKKDRQERKGTGRRTQTKTASTSGRYIYPSMTRRNNDLALDATIRAAAPFQSKRAKNGMALIVKDEDIREKVRQKKISNLLVFVVDASGSMGAVKRMTEAKGAVLSLLKDAYVKRDKISMVTFSGEGAEVVLPPTRSSQRGYRLLEDIKTGGKTPLNAGLEKGLRVIENQLRQNPDIMPMLIVITDGRGNMSIDSTKKPSEELLDIGEMISKEKRLDTMVIDIENNSLTSFGIAGKLANAMKAKYYRLDEIKSSQIEAIVRKEKI